jgi:hypothetical protein
MAHHTCKDGVVGCMACGTRDKLQARKQLLLQEQDKIDEILKIYDGKEWIFNETDHLLYNRHIKIK